MFKSLRSNIKLKLKAVPEMNIVLTIYRVINYKYKIAYLISRSGSPSQNSPCCRSTTLSTKLFEEGHHTALPQICSLPACEKNTGQ